MLQRNEIRGPMEIIKMRAASPQAQQTKDVLEIQEVVRRAREIHRQHGGMFGYDFEDWVRAWTELPERGSRTELGLVDEMNAEMVAGNTREVSEPCFGLTE